MQRYRGDKRNDIEQRTTDFFFSDSFWLRKKNTDVHILAHVDIEHPDDRYKKIILEMILDW